MKKLIALTLAAGFASVHAADFSYKGVKMGDEATVAAERLPDYTRSVAQSLSYSAEKCEATKQDCLSRNSFAGAKVNSGGIFFHNGRVDTLALQLSAAERGIVVQAVKDAYGPPIHEEEPVYQNAFGAKFPGYSAVWQSDASYMQISIRGDDKLSVMIESNARRDRRAASRRPATPASKDF